MGIVEAGLNVSGRPRVLFGARARRARDGPQMRTRIRGPGNFSVRATYQPRLPLDTLQPHAS